jgi:hypothetical protein
MFWGRNVTTKSSSSRLIDTCLRKGKALFLKDSTTSNADIFATDMPTKPHKSTVPAVKPIAQLKRGSSLGRWLRPLCGRRPIASALARVGLHPDRVIYCHTWNDRDVLPAEEGRGDEAKQGSHGPDRRALKPPVRTRGMYAPNLHISRKFLAIRRIVLEFNARCANLYCAMFVFCSKGTRWPLGPLSNGLMRPGTL